MTRLPHTLTLSYCFIFCLEEKNITYAFSEHCYYYNFRRFPGSWFFDTYMHEQSQLAVKRQAYKLCRVTQCTGHILANGIILHGNVILKVIHVEVGLGFGIETSWKQYTHLMISGNENGSKCITLLCSNITVYIYT